MNPGTEVLSIVGEGVVLSPLSHPGGPLSLFLIPRHHRTYDVSLPSIFLRTFLGLCPAWQNLASSITQVSETEARAG